VSASYTGEVVDMLIQIKSWLTDKVLFEGRYGDLSQAAVEFIKSQVGDK